MKEMMSLCDFMKAKKALEKASSQITYVNLGCGGTQPDLANSNGTVQQPKSCGQQETKVTKMDEKQHLRDRLYEIYLVKVNELQLHFKLNTVAPSTIEEAIERVKAGDYQLKDKKERYCYEYMWNHIIWRKPGEEADNEGYLVALVKLDAARKRAQDDIIVLDAEAGLDAMRKFEEAQFH